MKCHLNILINAMPFAVIVLNNDGTVLNVNAKTEEYFCVAREEVLGGNFDQWRRRVLTGLYNRRYLYEYLGSCKSIRITLLYLDLDDFKGINDRYGHQAGDTVLIATSTLLAQSFPRDTVVRMGGDEFIVTVTDDRPLEVVEEQAQAFLAALKGHFEAAESPWEVTGSAGIASTEDLDLPIDSLIKQGDAALYAAKRAGKSRCCLWSANFEH
ncbi:sensor domain-containing diguanylate cyclase [Gordonibacter sp.]|uniref:sensor domain-containing diguanylate cyclase n=2 Tax=Gordonibacter sp. TaxID=1968902 RepID=UPI002FCC0BAD